jgi:hypothetical protein
MIKHVIMLVTTTNSPLDQQLDGHALTTHTYQSIEAFDPYITTQADGIHTMARHIYNEIENRQQPPVSTLLSHLRVLNWA